MADDFDAFDEDFEIAYPEDSEGGAGSEATRPKESNPIKALLQKVMESKYLKTGIILGLIAIFIVIVILIITGVSKPSVEKEEISTPYHYMLPEYLFHLDEETNGLVPYVLLKLDLVFDIKYKEYSKIIGSATYQIKAEIVNEFIKSMTYYDLTDFNKRQEVYNRCKSYINRLLDKPIIKEILEERFDVELSKKNY